MAADNLTVETFVEFGIGMAFLLLRLFARVKVVGIRNFQLDDFFAMAAMIFWSLLTAIIYLLGVFGYNIGLNDETAMEVPESQVPSIVIGSKLAFMNWIWYLCYIWCLKGVLLCLYSKLTEGVWQHRLVRIMSTFCAMTWAACVLTHVCICTPVHRSWQVKPYPGDNCTIRRPNYVVIATLNVLSDIGILLIPVPLLFKLRVPLHRKIILMGMFSSGIFIMICTILRAYYSLKDLQSLPIALGWADRECFVAAVVVSLPGIKPLFRNSRWFGSSNKDSLKYTGKVSTPWSQLRSNRGGNTNTDRSSHVDNRGNGFELSSTTWAKKQMGAKRLSSGDSQEHILESTKGSDVEAGNPHAIHVTTEYILSREESDSKKSHE